MRSAQRIVACGFYRFSCLSQHVELQKQRFSFFSLLQASEELQGLMRSVTNDEIPAAWLRNHYDLLRFHRSSKLSRLINNIALRCSLLERYMNAATEPMPTCSAESPGASEVQRRLCLESRRQLHEI